MDIQRGDQVYYRGEVWTVKRVPIGGMERPTVLLRQEGKDGWNREKYAYRDSIQRVEQVR